MMNKHDKGNNYRLLAALVLSGVILLASDWLSVHVFGRSVAGATPAANVAAQPVDVAKVADVAVAQGLSATDVSASAAVAAPSVNLPLGMNGGCAHQHHRRAFDQLVLKNYKAEIDEADGFTFLKPSGKFAEYVAAGWMGAGIQGPDETTAWQAEGEAGKSVVLVWHNASGQAFKRTFEMEPDSYLVKVTDSVTNSAGVAGEFDAVCASASGGWFLAE